MEAKFELPEGAVEVIPSDAPSEYEMAPRAEEHKGRVADGLGETALGEEGMRGKGTSPRKSVGEEQPSSSTKGRKRKGHGSSRGRGGGGSGGGGRGGDRDNLGIAYTGRSFMSHVISVNGGANVCEAVVRFVLKRSRAICVLSMSGEISSVTLQQDATISTYEGRFEVINLSGYFNPLKDWVWTGEMSVTMAAPDGRILGGRITGHMRAASPVQVVVAVF